ncbi:enoyl-CoA hydratase-related protein, partial [Vibrio genomosp. F10]|uniref:enoyl-CoA hydratase-related protein n=1 Tax=Vibrio genomosp. F10 TaxID=723171 RepID=UPI001F515FD1
MSQSKAFHLKVDDNKVAWLSIDVPGEKMNTLQSAFVSEIKDILVELESYQSELKGVIIHSDKPDNFIAGADIRMLAECKTAQEAQALAVQGQEMFQALSDLPYPVRSEER